jgi:hypothetical protein
MLLKKAGIKLCPDYLPLFFLLGLTLWFSHGMIWEGKLPFFRDLGPYFYPIRFSLARSFIAGELPLWDRHMAMGFPLLADFQSAPFYPPHLLFLFLSFFKAINGLFLFHYLIAASGSYALARQWNYPIYLCLITAVLFTFGGIIISLTNVLNHFQTAVWLPWVILAGERVVRTLSGKDFLIFTGVALIQFLAGSPEFYLMSLGLVLIDVTAIAINRGSVSYLRPFLLIIAANVLVLGLSMIQLLPTLELFLQSRRPSNVSFQEATSWSLRPRSLINFFFLDKEFDASLFAGVRLFFAHDIPFFISLYIGQICLFGLCSWFYYAPRKNKQVISALILLGLAIALGRYTPLYFYLLTYVPFFGLFRFPEKFVFIVYPLLISIALQGLYTFLNSNDGTDKKPFLTLCSILTFLSIVYLFCRFWPDYFFASLRWSDLIEPALMPKIFPSFLFSLERQILLLAAMFLLFLLYKHEKLSRPVFNVLLVALVVVDLTSAHRPYQFLVESELVTDKPKIVSNPGSETYRLFSSLPNLHPSVFTFRERPFVEVTESVWSSLVPNVGIFYEVDYMQEIDALGRAPYDFFLQTAKNLPPERLYSLLGALNVKYISSFSPLPEGEIELVRHFPEYPLWLYWVEQPVPRVYVVPVTEHETDPVKTLERLASKDFDRFANVILDQPISLPNQAGFQAEAHLKEYENQVVNIQASLNQAGMLVLADSFYPGWNAYVNGRQAKVYRANLFFRAVQLSSGTHTVEFRYEPRSFAIGLRVSIVTLLAIPGVSMFLHLRRRRGNITAAAC